MRSFLMSMKARLGLVRDLFTYLWREHQFALIFVMVFLILLSGVVAIAQSSSVAPFIYALF